METTNNTEEATDLILPHVAKIRIANAYPSRLNVGDFKLGDVVSHVLGKTDSFSRA